MDKDTEKRDTLIQEEKKPDKEIKEPDFEEFKKDLKEKVRKKRESVKSKLEGQNFQMIIKTPEKEAKPVNDKKSLAKITPEQMNMLINGISNTVCFVRHTEEVTMDESGVFAKALYDVAEANGWLDDLKFLPYLVLAAAGTQLTITIMMKPKKKGYEEKIIKQKFAEPIKQEIQNNELPKGGDIDEVDSEALVKKINGL